MLIRTCQAINQLNADETRLALAAFLRERISRSKESVAASLTATAELVELIPIVELFVRRHSDGGRVGQAVVAAVFDLVFDNVHTGRINDPSRHLTGDVHAMTPDQIAAILTAEARQKPVSEADVRGFASAVAADGVPRALMVALDESQPHLDAAELGREALAEEGVLLTVVQSIPELFASACIWNTTGLDRVGDFPQLLLHRLHEIETAEAAISWWISRFGSGQKPLFERQP